MKKNPKQEDQEEQRSLTKIRWTAIVFCSLYIAIWLGVLLSA